MFRPLKVASIFSDDNDVIQVAGKMIKKSNICDFLCFVCYTVGDMNRYIARGIQGAANEELFRTIREVY